MQSSLFTFRTVEGKLSAVREPWYSKAILYCTPDRSLSYCKRQINVADWDLPDTYREKIKLQMEIRSRYVIRCLDSCEKDGVLDLYFDYAELGDLHSFRMRDGGVERLSEGFVKAVARQVLLGLAYLHESSSIHLDIKPKNILLFSEAPVQVRISDLALPRIVVQKYEGHTWVKTTFGYIAPEVQEHLLEEVLTPGSLEKSITTAVDIFCLGATLWDLLLGDGPVEYIPLGSDTVHPLYLPALEEAISAEGVKLITSMLNADPLKRPNASECLESAWFCQQPLLRSRKLYGEM